jgi:hypothetical protein
MWHKKLDKLGSQSRLDSRNICYIQTTTTLTFFLLLITLRLRGGRRLCVHKFNVTNLKLWKNVADSRKLDAYESIFLFKNKKKRMMNDEQQALDNIQSPPYVIFVRFKLKIKRNIYQN